MFLNPNPFNNSVLDSDVFPVPNVNNDKIVWHDNGENIKLVPSCTEAAVV